jgi:hypothetical protein
MAPTFERRVLVHHLDVEQLPRLPEELLVRALPPPHVRHQEHHLPLDEEPQRLDQGVNQRLVVHHVRRHDEVERCLRPRRRHLPHRGGVAPGERHDGGGGAGGGEEGRVEAGVVAEVGERAGEVGEDGAGRERRGQREPRGAGAGAELEDAERRGPRGWRAREEVRGGREDAEERGCGGPELERQAPRGERAHGDGGRDGRDVEVMELRVRQGGRCRGGREEVWKEEEVFGVGVRRGGGGERAGGFGGGGHRASCDCAGGFTRSKPWSVGPSETVVCIAILT